tara:strand:- start:126 stop:794 length:669 start_codon:yes stop_codon:yes gene_type:complete
MVIRRRKVKRHENKKGYSVEGYDQPFVGITTLLSKTKDEESRKALLRYHSIPGNTQKTKQATQRGLYAHRTLEQYGKGIPVHKGKAYALFKGYIDPLIEWFDNNVTEVLAQEEAVFHPDGFAGTYDLLATLKEHGDQPVLCDYKTSQRSRLANPMLCHDYCCQLAAYALCSDFRGQPISRALLIIAVNGELELKSIGPGPMKAYKNAFKERVLEYKQLELSK